MNYQVARTCKALPLKAFLISLGRTIILCIQDKHSKLTHPLLLNGKLIFSPGYKPVTMINAIGYCRVSTKGQEKTGYGIDAQKRNLKDFAKRNNYKLLFIYVEIASGKDDNRLVIKKAIAACKKMSAVLLVPKMCRLARSVWFVAALIKSGFEFILIDMPAATKVFKYILAAFAEHEGDLSSIRTLDGMKSAILRGIKFGTGITKTHLKLRRAYILFAKHMKPTIKNLKAEGFITVKQLRDILNKRKKKAFRGGVWYLSTVHRLLQEIFPHNKNNKT